MHIFNQGIRDWFPDLKMTIIKFCKDKTYCHGYTTSESLSRQWHESDVILGCFIGSSWSLFLSSDIVKDSQKIRFLTLPPVFLPFCVSIQVLNGSTAHDGPGNVPNRDPRALRFTTLRCIWTSAKGPENIPGNTDPFYREVCVKDGWKKKFRCKRILV